MSLKYLENYLEKNPVKSTLAQITRTLILVSDSKGCKLRRIVERSEPENSIVWCCKGGRNSFQAANYIIENLDYFVHKYGQILIAVWTGTCDLTQFSCRSKRYIDLNQITVEDIVSQYQKIITASVKYGSKIKLVFLECPQYSISIWNETKGHPNSENFKSSTNILLSMITELNTAIRRLNTENGVSAPKFSLDLVKSRKSNKSYTTEKVTYSLLTDGIHPCLTLCRYWLRRIVHSLMLLHCYT